MSKMYLAVMCMVFVLACSLRIGLALVNNGEANDNHFRVSYIILTENRIPQRNECEECYHPKLFHVTVAKLWRLLWKQEKVIRDLVTNAQLLNALTGIGTIVLLWIFIHCLPIGTNAKIFSFSLIALNTELIGINAQITNDTFAIFFTTIAMYCLFRYVSQGKVFFLVIMTLSATLAALSKGNALVFFAATVLILLLRILVQGKSRWQMKGGYIVPLLIFVTIFLGVAGTMGGYFQKQSGQGGLEINVTKDPLPPLAGTDNYHFRRLGVTSILNSYFTFRFIDLLKHPRITNGFPAVPGHRTSLWTQLYGRTHFIYFADNPTGLWQADSESILNCGRVIFVLALFPTVLLCWGLLKRAYFWGRALVSWKWNFITQEAFWIFDVFMFSYILFIIVFTLQYRDFCSMKSIYIYPALLAAGYFLAIELNNFYEKFNNRALHIFANIVLTTLLGLYVAVIGNMIYRGALG